MRIVYFSVDSLGRFKFSEKDESWGFRGGYFFATSVSLCVLSTIYVS